MHSGQSRLRTWQLGAPLFLTTLSTLLLELGLTRLFSVVLFYHYAFLVISQALLGLAMGALAARAIPRDLSPEKLSRTLGAASLLGCVSLFPALRLILDTNIWLVDSWTLVGRFVVLYFACLIPFVIAGFVIAAVMSTGARQVASLYSWDLLGASLGCLLFVPFIVRFGGPSVVLVVGACWCLSAALWFHGGRSPRWVAASLAAFLAMVAVVHWNRDGSLFDVRFMRGQPLKNEVFAKWNSFSRVSVHRDEKDFHWIEIDGGAGTWIPETDLRDGVLEEKRATFGSTGPEIAMWLADEPSTLIVGTGGGLDILRAVYAGSRSITAVEINPIIADDVMRGAFHGYSHGLYGCREDPPEPGCIGRRVEVHVEDGRSFIQRTDEAFDVIQLSQVDTWASTSSGAYGLTENYLYTVEALESYLGRLTDAGLLSISRWEFEKPRETLRLTAVALEALERNGVADPSRHVVVLLDDQLDQPQSRFGTVLVQRAPFTDEQVDRILARIDGTLVNVAFVPGQPVGDETFRELVLATDRDAFYASYEFDVTPVFDDRPFFFFTDRWSNFFAGLHAHEASGDTMSRSAQHLLLLVLALSVLATAAFLFGPLLLFRRAFPLATGLAPCLGYCLSVGLAYILVEIALIHRFVVFLGQPVFSLTVVVFSMLLSSGLGSRTLRGLSGPELQRRGGVALVATIALAVAAVYCLPSITTATQAAPLAWKIVIVVATTFPLGFLMGMPFPAGLGLMFRFRSDGLEWAWAMNSCGTVLGSILATFIAVNVGLPATLLAGAACYVTGAVLLRRLVRVEEPAVEQVEALAA